MLIFDVAIKIVTHNPAEILQADIIIVILKEDFCYG